MISTKSQHRALDHVFQRAVRLDAHRVPLARLGLHFSFARNQRVQHLPRVRHQAVIALEPGDDVAHWPPDIGLDEVDDARSPA